MNTTVYEETLTGRPHDTSVKKATSDIENVDAVERHVKDDSQRRNIMAPPGFVLNQVTISLTTLMHCLSYLIYVIYVNKFILYYIILYYITQV